MALAAMGAMAITAAKVMTMKPVLGLLGLTTTGASTVTVLRAYNQDIVSCLL